MLRLTTVLLLSFSWSATTFASGGGSMPSSSSMPQMEVKSPEQIAAERYNMGLKNRDKGDKHSLRAADADSDKARAKYEKKAAKQYQAAAKNFKRALKEKKRFYQAWSDLGYVYRKLGKFEESLAAYDKSLSIKPNYAQAIEYRGEAYLALNRLDDAKQAYMKLYQIDPTMAAEMLGAMGLWLDQRQQNPAGLPETAIDGFAQWVSERASLAKQTGVPSTTTPTRTLW